MASKRPSKRKRGPSPLVIVLSVCGFLLVLLVVGLMVAKSLVGGWLRGDGFRDWLARRSAQVLRSEVSLSDLEWSGSEVFAKRFTALGREDAGFSELKLDGVRASAGGIADRAVRVPAVSVNRLDLRFAPERPGGPAPPSAVPAAAPTPAEGGAGMPAWLSKYLPDRVEVDEIEIASTRLSVAREEGEVFLLSGTSAVIEPDFGTGFFAIRGRGGKAAMVGAPDLAVKNLSLRWRGDELFLDRCSVGIFRDGHIEASGEIGFADEGGLDLELEVSSIDVDELVPPEWGERLSGTLAGPVRISGTLSEPVAEGTLRVADGVVQSLPLLKQIARYTRSERFERLVLNQATADFRVEGQRVELSRIRLQSDGLVRVEGRLDIDGDSLDGDLEVGVAPGTMRWIPGAERSVFTKERDGFLWTPMKLAGTRDAPKEDLTLRLVAAAGEAVVRDLPGGVIDAARELVAPGGEGGKGDGIIDQGKKVLDRLSPFLKAP